MKKFIIIGATAVIILLAYIWYPKSGSFNKLIFNKFSELNLSEIDIYKGEMLQDEKRATDEKKVSDFVSALKEVQLTKYNSKPANLGKTLYTIDI